MATKSLTRDKIIKEAFLLYSQPVDNRISLNDIAKKVGISKTALFRHFVNKEELLNCLQEIFFDDLAKVLRPLTEINSYKGIKQTTSAVIDFSMAHPEYLGYFSNMKFFTPKANHVFLQELKDRDIGIVEKIFEGEYFKTAKFTPTAIFFTVTIVFYLINRMILIASKKEVIEIELFKEKITNLLCYGIGQKEKISDERKLELDKIVTLSKDEYIEENPFFKAFVEVINTEGYWGVTLDRIAEKLGMSKSSLYFHFESKDALVKNLIGDEFYRMMTILSEKAEYAKTADEEIYVFFRTAVEYFRLNPSVIRVFEWLIHQNKNGKKMGLSGSYDFSKNMVPENFDPGVPVNENLFKGWLFALISVDMNMGFCLGDTEQKVLDSVLYIYGLIINGVDIQEAEKKNEI